MIHNDNFVFFILVLKELGDDFVLFNARTWEIQGFFDVELFILISFAKIEKKEISFDSNWKLLSFDGDRSKVGCLTSRIVIWLIDIVDRLSFDFLVKHLPQSTRFDPPKKFTLPFGNFFIA